MSIYKSKGVDFDNLFDPDVVGDGPVAADYKQGGAPIKYAALKYGTKRADVGYKQADVDVSNLWAAKGTASYALPIDGQTFVQGDAEPPGTTPNAGLDFEIGAGGWSVVGTSRSAGSFPKASGAKPANATSVQITATWLNAVGDTDAGTVTNTAAAYTAIPATGTVGCSVRETHGGTGTTGQTSYRLVIRMKNASGNVISTTTITFSCNTSTG